MLWLTYLSSDFEKLLQDAGHAEPKFEQVPFNTPMLVMFSSGTTGAPKGIVHGHGVCFVTLEHYTCVRG